MFSGLESPAHLLVLAVVVMLLFGPKRLPELAKSLGSGIREFRESVGGGSDDEESNATRIASEADAIKERART